MRRLFSRPDFNRNPFLAVWKRFYWRFRWLLVKDPWELTMSNRQKIFVKRCGSAALIYFLGQSEPSTAKFITKYLKPGMVFYDVGALLGEYTLLSADLVKPDGMVHFFEPNHEYFDIIIHNIHRNQLLNVVPNCLALSDVIGEATLLVPSDPSYAHLQLEYTPERSNGMRAETVVTTTLDDYFNQFGGKVDLIKIDTEGAEFRVLSSGRNLLKLGSDEAPVWVIEYSPENYARFGTDFKDISNLLRQYGYKFLSLLPDGQLHPIDDMNLGSGGRNYVAVKDLTNIKHHLGGL